MYTLTLILVVTVVTDHYLYVLFPYIELYGLFCQNSQHMVSKIDSSKLFNTPK